MRILCCFQFAKGEEGVDIAGGKEEEKEEK